MNRTTPPPKRLFCNGCGEESVFQYIGDNLAGRPVRECSACEERKPGFFDAAPTAEIAADGGGDPT